jgi:hypothetical protein
VFQIAGPIAIASMAVGLGLRFAFAWAVNAYATASMPPPTPPPTPPPATAPAPVVAASQPATQPATQPVVPESAKDKAIRDRIASGELKEFYTYDFHGGYQRSLMKKLYEAKPRNMYIETRAFLAPKLYVELPSREDRRAACFAAYRDYVDDGGGMEIDPNEEKDIGQKFLVIRLAK